VLAAIVLGIPTAGIVTVIVILFVFPAMAVMEVLRAGGRTKVGREIGSAMERSAQRASERRQAESYPRLANAGEARGIRVKIYKSSGAFQSDAHKMMRAGWRMEGQVAQGGHVSVGKTLLKGNLTLGLGYLTGFSRTKDKITVTWVR
jgi:hypothetical protein